MVSSVLVVIQKISLKQTAQNKTKKQNVRIDKMVKSSTRHFALLFDNRLEKWLCRMLKNVETGMIAKKKSIKTFVALPQVIMQTRSTRRSHAMPTTTSLRVLLFILPTNKINKTNKARQSQMSSVPWDKRNNAKARNKYIIARHIQAIRRGVPFVNERLLADKDFISCSFDL